MTTQHRITPEQIKEIDAFGRKLGDWLNEQVKQGAEWSIIMTALMVTQACAMSDRAPDKKALEQLVTVAQHDLWLQAMDRWAKTRMN